MNYDDAIIQANAKGQIVIPKHIRETLQIDQKTYLRLITRGSVIYLEPIKEFVGAESQKLRNQLFLKVLQRTQGAWGPETKAEKVLEKKRRALESRASKARKKAW